MIGSSILGQDPQTINRLNGESFQQDALVTFNGELRCIFDVMRATLNGQTGYQYAAFYVNDGLNASVRHPSLARRALKGQKSTWETFSFTDYNQTEDDGHDGGERRNPCNPWKS